MKASDLLLSGFAKYGRIDSRLIEINDDNKIIGVCAIGALGIEAGCTPQQLEAADEIGVYLEITTRVNAFLGCNILARIESDHPYHELIELNDRDYETEALVAWLDTRQAEACGELE